MTYTEIRHLLIANNLDCSIDLDIASCVSNCVGLNVDDNTFRLLCSYVRHIFDNVEKTYTQLIADIVCDCYAELEYEYRFKCKLTKKDLEEYNHDDKIIEIYLDRYYN